MQICVISRRLTKTRFGGTIISKKAKGVSGTGRKDILVGKEFTFRQIGAKIIYYRTLRRMTQRELARKIHVSLSTLGRIERGSYNHDISVSLLLDLAYALGVKIHLLLDFPDEEKQIWWEELSNETEDEEAD